MSRAEQLVRRLLGEPEVIGREECPILFRWGLLGEDRKTPCGRCGGHGHYELGGVADVRCEQCDGEGALTVRRPVKLLLHYFAPESRDRDPHDHPRPFWTFVLAGDYTDERYLTRAELGRIAVDPDHGYMFDGRQLDIAEGDLVLRERMTRGCLRLRRAGHTHKTWAGARGCWTLVLMGPIRRPWGFWRAGTWWPQKLYEQRFGDGMRCE